MNTFIKLLNTKFINQESIIEEYVNYINTHKLKADTQRDEEYFEIHHILPRSLFPEYEYEPTNLVKLKLYDHFVAHYIIAKTRNSKMLYAFNMMNRTKKSMNEIELDSAAKMYSELKQDFVEMVREQALNRPEMSDETKAKLRDFGQGKVFATNKETLVCSRISKEEYYSNPDLYTHHMNGKTHSDETKQKMSENGIKGKIAFHHIKTLDVIFENENFSHPEYKKGNPIASIAASERFNDAKHWTHKITGESIRSKENPGSDWIQKRVFNNAAKGKAALLNIKTGENDLYADDEITNYTIIHNKLIVVSDDVIYTNILKLLEKLNIDQTKANSKNILKYLANKPVPKSFAKNDLSELSKFKVIKASELKYSNQIIF